MGLTMDLKGGFPRVATTKKTLVSVGFEWEIPADLKEGLCSYCEESGEEYCDCEGDQVEASFATEQFIETHGFRTHVECGGLEFASPVFGNIETARRIAKELQKVARTDSCFHHRNYGYSECGIHVHASHANIKGHTEMLDFEQRVVSMLNRKDSAQFVWEFSGRDDTRYGNQAKATQWDAEGLEEPTEKQHGFMRSNQMVRLNCFGGDYTVEYRLWDADEGRLLPAIEFAHAVTTFMSKRKDIPYLKDFKNWLDKQSGYNILKADSAWRLA